MKFHLVCYDCAFEVVTDGELGARERLADHRDSHPDHRAVYKAVGR